jgi:hypothetical protein
VQCRSKAKFNELYIREYTISHERDRRKYTHRDARLYLG